MNCDDFRHHLNFDKVGLCMCFALIAMVSQLIVVDRIVDRLQTFSDAIGLKTSEYALELILRTNILPLVSTPPLPAVIVCPFYQGKAY